VTARRWPGRVGRARSDEWTTTTAATFTKQTRDDGIGDLRARRVSDRAKVSYGNTDVATSPDPQKVIKFQGSEVLDFTAARPLARQTRCRPDLGMKITERIRILVRCGVKFEFNDKSLGRYVI